MSDPNNYRQYNCNIQCPKFKTNEARIRTLLDKDNRDIYSLVDANAQDIDDAFTSIATINTTLSDHDTRFDGLETSLTDLTSTVSTHTSEIASLTSSVTSNTNTLSSHASTLTSYGNRISSTESDVSDMKITDITLAANIAAADAAAVAAGATAASALADATVANTRIGVLDTELNAPLTGKLTLMQNSIDDAHARLGGADSRLDTLEEWAPTVDQRLGDDRDFITQHGVMLDELDTAVGDHTAMLQQHGTMLDTFDTEIATVNESLQAMNGTLDAQGERITATETSLTDHEGRLGTAETRMGTIETNAETNYNYHEGRLDNHQSLIEAQDVEIQQNSTDILNLRGDLTTTNTRSLETQAALVNTDATVAGHTTSIGALDTTLAGHTTSIGALDTALATTNGVVAGHTTSIGALDTALAATNGVVAGHTASIATLQTAVGTVDTELATSIAALFTTTSGHSTDITALETRMTSAETDITDLSDRSVYDAGRITDNANSINSLNTSVTNLQTDNTTNKSNITSLQTSVTNLQSTDTTLQSKITAVTYSKDNSSHNSVLKVDSVADLDNLAVYTNGGFSASVGYVIDGDSTTQLNYWYPWNPPVSTFRLSFGFSQIVIVNTITLTFHENGIYCPNGISIYNTYGGTLLYSDTTNYNTQTQTTITLSQLYTGTTIYIQLGKTSGGVSVLIKEVVFKGSTYTSDISSNVTVGGALYVKKNETSTFAGNLTVSGNTSLAGLTVTGNPQITGNVSVTGKVTRTIPHYARVSSQAQSLPVADTKYTILFQTLKQDIGTHNITYSNGTFTSTVSQLLLICYSIPQAASSGSAWKYSFIAVTSGGTTQHYAYVCNYPSSIYTMMSASAVVYVNANDTFVIKTCASTSTSTVQDTTQDFINKVSITCL